MELILIRFELAGGATPEGVTVTLFFSSQEPKHRKACGTATSSTSTSLTLYIMDRREQVFVLFYINCDIFINDP